MLFIFVDTNIYIRIMTQGMPGCDFALFDDLKTLCENKIICLLVPEVILLELEKNNTEIPQGLKQKFCGLRKDIEKFSLWTEIRDIKNYIITLLQKAEDLKITNWKNRYKEIISFLNSDKTIKIPITENIKIKADNRIKNGKMPKNKKVDKDACIIESLVEYFNSLKDNNSTLIFCSENTNDFAEECKTATKDRSFILHHLLQNDLPKSHYFIDLNSTLQFSKGYESLPEIKPNEEIEEKLKILNSFEDDWEDLPDEWSKTLREIESLEHNQLAKEFEKGIIPKLSNEIVIKRQNLIKEIKFLLSKCRRCKSWDERSEEKLLQWTEYVPEDMIPYTSLPNLLRIRKNIKRYLDIHKEMDNNIDSH